MTRRVHTTPVHPSTDRAIQYDPIKDRFGRVFTRHPVLQRMFYALLGGLFLRNWYVRRYLRTLYPDPQQPLRVLDAGTGFGQYAYYMAKKYPRARVLAVDVKQHYLETARAFMDQTPFGNRVTFAWADLTQIDLVEAVDLILSVDVMEHIEDDHAVFRNFERALRPGGHIVINTPSDQGGSNVTEEGEESFISEHVRDGYNPVDLVEKLRAAGLESIDGAYTYGRFGAAGWKMLIQWPMRLLNAAWWMVAVLPIYYLVAFPVGMVLNALDVREENKTGTGLIIVARKPDGLNDPG